MLHGRILCEEVVGKSSDVDEQAITDLLEEVVGTNLLGGQERLDRDLVRESKTCAEEVVEGPEAIRRVVNVFVEGVASGVLHRLLSLKPVEESGKLVSLLHREAVLESAGVNLDVREPLGKAACLGRHRIVRLGYGSTGVHCSWGGRARPHRVQYSSRSAWDACAKRRGWG